MQMNIGYLTLNRLLWGLYSGGDEYKALLRQISWQQAKTPFIIFD